MVARPGEQPSVAMRMSPLPSFPSVINHATATLTEMVTVPMSRVSIMRLCFIVKLNYASSGTVGGTQYGVAKVLLFFVVLYFRF